MRRFDSDPRLQFSLCRISQLTSVSRRVPLVPPSSTSPDMFLELLLTV